MTRVERKIGGADNAEEAEVKKETVCVCGGGGRTDGGVHHQAQATEQSVATPSGWCRETMEKID